MTESTLIVTGGAGFIGSNLIRRILDDSNRHVVNVDNLSYAGSRLTVADLDSHPRHHFEHVDICDARRINELFVEHKPDAVVHLAAESHVDRSIDTPADFIRTNVVGTYTLLEASLAHWMTLTPTAQAAFRFHHVSTDEVYGSLGFDDPPFTESTPYAPSSPYAASKAASDHLVNAWYRTYGLPTLLSNCTNNYGPYQFPEKLIPLVIDKAVHGAPIPIYGQGTNIRDWIHVDDHARALFAVLSKGSPGERYNISARCERSNLEVVTTICHLLDDLRPEDPVVPHADLIEFVTDRPGHDLRYAMDNDKAVKELGWCPGLTFEEAIADTLIWYLDNAEWCAGVTSDSYDGSRLGRRGVAAVKG